MHGGCVRGQRAQVSWVYCTQLRSPESTAHRWGLLSVLHTSSTSWHQTAVAHRYIHWISCFGNKRREVSSAGHQRQGGQDSGGQCYDSSFSLHKVSPVDWRTTSLSLCLWITHLWPEKFEMSVTLLPESKKLSNAHQSTTGSLDFRSPCLNALEVSCVLAEKQR